MELAKDYVRHLVHSKSERVSLVLSDTMRSAVWTCFYKIFVDGYQTSFVVCRNCGHILKYTPKDGTTAMRIHMGKFCGRMKAKAVQGAPQTPLIPTATASGANGLTRLTPTPNGNLDEPLDLQKPQLKAPSILASNNSSNSLGNGHHNHPLSHLAPGAMDSPLTAAASAIAAAAAALTGNNGGVSAASFPSLNSSGTRHHASLPIGRQMTPTAKAQEILSAFNPIPPSALPTPKMLFLPGCINNNNNNNNHQQQSSSSSNTPTSPSQVTSGVGLFGAANSSNPLQLQNRSSSGTDAPCNLVVKRPTADSPVSNLLSRGGVGSDGIEAVAVAFKAALATFDEDLRELDAKISETEAQLEKLRSKRVNLIANRDHVNKAARVVLNSVNDQDPSSSQPVDAMIEWVRRNSTASSIDSVGLKRSAQTFQNNNNNASPLSNWPQDLQLQFSRGPKRLRKAYTAVRRGVPSNPGTSSTALGNASELLNGVVPMSSTSPSKTSGVGVVLQDPSNVGENGGEINVIGNSDGSSVANTPPSSEYLPPDDEDHDDNFMGVKSEHMEDIDVEDDSEADNSSANNSLLIDETGPPHLNNNNQSGENFYPSSLHLQSKTLLFDTIGGPFTVTCATLTSAFIFVGTSSGAVLRYDIRETGLSPSNNPVLFTPFVDNQAINCIDAWIFGENDDDFAILLGTDRGVVRIYNPDLTNLLCEKKLNWPITALRVVAKRHVAYVGLKMGVLVSIDLDKMELAAKIVCGFGSIVDVEWLAENDLLFVATEDGAVSIRDLTGQVISNIDLSSVSPLSHIRAMMTDHEIFVIASSQKRGGLVAASLLVDGQPSGRPFFDILPPPPQTNSQDESLIVTQFGHLCHNAMFAIDQVGKFSALRLSDDQAHVLMTQEVLDHDLESSTQLVFASSQNNESCTLITSNGLVKIFRLTTMTN